MPIRTKQIIRPRTTGVTLGVWLRMQSSLEKAAWFAGRGSRLTQYFQKQDRRLVHVRKHLLGLNGYSEVVIGAVGVILVTGASGVLECSGLYYVNVNCYRELIHVPGTTK